MPLPKAVQNFKRCRRQRLKFLSAVADGTWKLVKEHNFVWFSKQYILSAVGDGGKKL
jgi:hypothetical protein